VQQSNLGSNLNAKQIFSKPKKIDTQKIFFVFYIQDDFSTPFLLSKCQSLFKSVPNLFQGVRKLTRKPKILSIFRRNSFRCLEIMSPKRFIWFFLRVDARISFPKALQCYCIKAFPIKINVYFYL